MDTVLPTPPDRDVAVFIDFENIYISVLNEYEANPDFESILDKCRDFGRVTIAQAYADWAPYSHFISALYANGIEPMYVPTFRYGPDGARQGQAVKNSVDMFMVINVMKTLYSRNNIQTYVLVTGDRDFIPLVKAIREYGKRAVVIGVAGAASTHLAQSADEFYFYHQLSDALAQKAKKKDIYDALVEAVHLARQRGYASTFASLKLLMAEILGAFDQTEHCDAEGRPFAKFKDFVKEAERRGLVQMFTSGTVNEVFLPGENPRELSRFADEVPAAPAEEEAEAEAEEEAAEALSVTPAQWRIFVDTMEQFDKPILFVTAFNALRGQRNQGLLDLSNKQLKDMIIQAIHSNLLTRTGRGHRAYYSLTTDAAVTAKFTGKR